MNLRRIIVALALVVSVASSAQDMTSVFVDAVSLYNSNQYGRSKELLENIIKKEPANDAAYYYLALCEEEGSSPEIAYKGSFNVRFKKKENHRRAAIYAMTHGQSLNSFIEETVEERLNAMHA